MPYILGMATKDVAFGVLAEELESRMAEGVSRPWTGDGFEDLALRAFRVQFEHVPAFRAFCEARGRTPATVERWQDVPAVPARAFKHIDFCVSEPELVFLTSGTTRGAEERGRHLVPRASLYRASLIPPFRAHLLGSAVSIPLLSLVPPAEAMPHSSLSWMVSAAAAELASEARWLVSGDGTLDEAGLRRAMRDAAESGESVLLLGTALSLLHAVRSLERTAAEPLPMGSRVMETGGFKGTGREIGRAELYDRIARATGVPPARIVSEYGMTELLSQLYTPVLSEGTSDPVEHVAPPWLVVRALEPMTLEELPEGEAGLLVFYDLANAGSVSHVLTEDIGSVVAGRVRLHGRVRGAEPRGCSRAMDELMSSAGARR
jgi:hypothetical protein